MVALWNAPFHAAEPSDVPGELGLLLAFLEELRHELRRRVVRLADVGMVLRLVLPDRVVVLRLGLGGQQHAVLVREDVDVVPLAERRVDQPEQADGRLVAVWPCGHADVQGLAIRHIGFLPPVSQGDRQCQMALSLFSMSRSTSSSMLLTRTVSASRSRVIPRCRSETSS